MTEVNEVNELRAEVAALAAEVAALRGHVCLPGPSCTCGGTATPGVTGCPVHSWQQIHYHFPTMGAAPQPWQQVIYPATAQPWYYPTNVCAGAAGYPGTVIMNTTACAEPPAGQVYTVPVP